MGAVGELICSPASSSCQLSCNNPSTRSSSRSSRSSTLPPCLVHCRLPGAALQITAGRRHRGHCCHTLQCHCCHPAIPPEEASQPQACHTRNCRRRREGTGAPAAGTWPLPPLPPLHQGVACLPPCHPGSARWVTHCILCLYICPVASVWEPALTSLLLDKGTDFPMINTPHNDHNECRVLCAVHVTCMNCSIPPPRIPPSVTQLLSDTPVGKILAYRFDKSISLPRLNVGAIGTNTSKCH